MKKNFKSIFAAFAAFAVVLSCSKVDEPELPINSGDGASGTITISATLSDALTKVAFTPSYGADGKPESLALAWEAGDKLRVYDHADKTQYEDFELTASSVGQKTGYFTGTLPAADSYDVEVINGDVDYAVQAQPADGVTSSLKYLASAYAVTDVKALTFTDYSSVLAITAKLPEGVAAVVGSVDITASEAIFSTGKTLTISLAEKGDAGNDGILHLFANLPQGEVQIPEGTTLLVHFNAPDADHTVYTRYVELGAQTFAAGKLNTISVNASQSDKHAGLATCDGTTSEKAYLIGDKYQMQAMLSLMKAEATTYFKMVDDVDLEGVAWTPLNNVSPYDKSINFDGESHTISNFSINGTDHKYPSFVGNLSGSFNNVTFDGAEVVCASEKGGIVAGSLGYEESTGNCSKVVIKNSTVTADEMAGALAALANKIGTVSECNIINTNVISTTSRAGALVGSIAAFEKISDCSAENITVMATQYAGGLIGQIDGGGTVTGCHSTGSVSADNKYGRSGGLVGYLIEGTVENSYSACDVTLVGTYGGGLIGDALKATIKECYATGKVAQSNHYSGGIIGNIVVGGSVNVEKSYFAGSIDLTTGYAGAGGIVGRMQENTSVTISNCYSKGAVVCRRYCGGIVGWGEDVGQLISVKNCFTTMTFSNGSNGALFGCQKFPVENVTCSGLIAWWESGNIVGNGNAITSGFYIGQEGSISAKAKEFDWDENVWDLTGSEPVLKP